MSHGKFNVGVEGCAERGKENTDVKEDSNRECGPQSKTLPRLLVKENAQENFSTQNNIYKGKCIQMQFKGRARFYSKWAANFGSVLCVVLAIESWTKHEQRGSEVFLQV